ncbi:hypothetical protein FACS1894152_3070 [Bacilli bacterium]|nr:hypothetical protein FACS1894152_3070 [Bacilli bacterium]
MKTKKFKSLFLFYLVLGAALGVGGIVGAAPTETDSDKAEEECAEIADIDVESDFGFADAKRANSFVKRVIICLKISRNNVKIAQIEARIAQGEAGVAQGEVKIAQIEARIAQGEVKIAQIEARIAQAEVEEARDEAKIAKIKSLSQCFSPNNVMEASQQEESDGQNDTNN